jgi:hypothetical protein
MINIKELSMTANDLKTSAVLFWAEDGLLDFDVVVLASRIPHLR